MKVALALGFALSALGAKGCMYQGQALRCGSWQYGDDPDSGFDLDEKTLRELEANFKAGEKGAEVPLMYTHDDGAMAQCGWVKLIETEGTGENALTRAYFDITDGDVRRKVDEGSIKYLSSELDLHYVNPERARTEGDRTPRKVFEGLALTNRPYIKGMAPIGTVTLSERTPTSKEKTKPLPPEPTQEETLRLTEQNRELQTKLDETIRLAEDTRKRAERTTRETRMKLNESIIRDRVTALKLSPDTANRLIRLNTLLCLGGADTIRLSEPVRVSKVKLAEGEKAGEEDVTNVDVLSDVLDILQEMPDSLATEAKLADDDTVADDAEKDKEDAAIKAAEKRVKADKSKPFHIVLSEERKSRGLVGGAS